MNIPETVYRRHIIRARGAGNYFYFDRSYADIPGVSKLTALFLQDIYNIASMPNTIRQMIDDKEYFLCTSEFLDNNGLKWSRDEQKYHLTALRDRKDKEENSLGPPLIHFCRQGMPPRRWVCIDVVAIEAELDNLEDDAKQSVEKPPIDRRESTPNERRESTPNTYKKERGKKERGGAALPPAPHVNGYHKPATNGDGNGFHKSPAPDPDLKAARKELREGLVRLGVIWCDKETATSAAEHLEKVRQSDPEEYRIVITSFVANYRQRRDLGMPKEISSCHQFMQRYGWIKGKLEEAGIIASREDDPRDLMEETEEVQADGSKTYHVKIKR